MTLDPHKLSSGYHASGNISAAAVTAFRKDIYAAYRAGRRSMPWRETHNPYHILVSEIMLQQTQVERVKSKYAQFLEAFPDIASLAAAELSDVLGVWKGLGYNRRALALKRCAEDIMERFAGRFPDTVSALESLPGIGPYTARAVAAFAFHVAEPLIETNIRTVFIHLFFHGQTDIHDRDIMPLVEATLDRKDPRNWYYALMDYGAELKARHPNPGRHSRHHALQQKFEGSNRQQRSRILQTLLEKPRLTPCALAKCLSASLNQVKKNLSDLEREGFLEEEAGRYRVRSS